MSVLIVDRASSNPNQNTDLSGDNIADTISSNPYKDLRVPTKEQAENIIEKIEIERDDGNITSTENRITNEMGNGYFLELKKDATYNIVLVSGLGATTLPLRPLANYLYTKLNANVGVIPLAGHGRLLEEAGTSTLKDFTGQVSGALDYLRSKNSDTYKPIIIAIGHSTGCKVIEALIGSTNQSLTGDKNSTDIYRNVISKYISIAPATVLKNRFHEVGLRILKAYPLVKKIPELKIIKPLAIFIPKKLRNLLSNTFVNCKFNTTVKENRKDPLEILAGMLGNPFLPAEALIHFQNTREAGNRSLKKIAIDTLLLTGGADNLVDSKRTYRKVRDSINGKLKPIHINDGSHQLQLGPNQERIHEEIKNFIEPED